jgi:RimJ/RimL family protein N-acetyltransferase
MEPPGTRGAGDGPVVNIVGDLVALGPHRRDLLPLYQRWMNDLGALRTLSSAAPRPVTTEQQAAWNDAGPAADEVRFTIYERATRRPVGTTELFGVDHRNRSAGWGVLIGEPECRGKGFGTETARLMLDYAFTALGLHSVLLTCAAYNLAGQRAYAKAGFREVGRRRECRRLGDRLWDEVDMDCLAPEFSSPVLGRVLVPDDPGP